MTDTIMTTVDTLERIERLQRGLVAKNRAWKEAEAAVENAGWNKSAALRKVREAFEAMDAQETEILELRDTLPLQRDDGTSWLYQRVAEIRVDRSAFEKKVTAAEAGLAEATAEAEKDSWKWKARAASGAGGEPKALTAAREALAAVQKEKRAFESECEEILAHFDAHLTLHREAAEVAAWAAAGYEGERPESIVRAEREFAEEMAEGCDRLKLGKRRYITVGTCTGLTEEITDPVLAPGDWGTPMTMEEYLNELIPPPPPPEEFKPSTKGGTPAWIKKMIEGRKAARARQAALVA
ncbi:MAG: hypothetical protein ACRC1H_01485, partial [Caldilineaceae bacterium]